MAPRNWTDIQSIVIDGRLALTKLIRGGRQSAIFETTDPDSEGHPTYFVQLVRATDAAEAGQIVNRLEEARYLNHPGILRLLGVGVIDTENLVFCVTPKPLSVLAEAPGPMPVEEAQLLTANLASVLSYLHSENLVFCNVRPEAVWKTENGWGLADFSQLRLIGRADTHELRRALVRYGDIPPEAYQGVVSPSWDVWSLGVLLQRVFTGDPGTGNDGNHTVPRARQLRAGLPEPFQRIVRECLDPNPNARPSIERIEALLNGTEPEEQPKAEPALASVPPVAASPVAASPVAVPRPGPPPAWAPRRLREMDETRHPRSLGEFLRTSRLSWLVIFIIGVLGVGIWTFALTRKPEQRIAAAPVTAAPAEADRVNPRTASPVTPAPPSDPAIREFLDKWVATMRSKDLNAQVALYAPVLDTFYSQHRVTRNHIAWVKRREFSNMGTVRKFEATNVQITQLDPSNAVILFDKNWTFGSDSSRSGSARSQLTLKKINGEWKVLSERELKTAAS